MTIATQPTEQPALMTIEECSHYLQISRTHAYQLAAEGKLPTIRLGRSVRIRRDRLAAWIEQQSR